VVEVTKLFDEVKDSSLCQLASRKCGSFSDLRFFPSTIGLAYMEFFPTAERGLNGVS
jgi:hypothetical protein